MQNYDEDLVDRFHPVIRGVAIGSILFGVLLNIMIYKWRSLVDWCYLYEMFFMTVYMSVPSSKITYSVYNSLMTNGVYFVLYYTEKRSQIWLGTIFIVINLFYTDRYILGKQDYNSLIGSISLLMVSFLSFSFSCCIAIIMNYIGELHLTLKKYIEQSSKLLDGMHEGLVIISKATGKTLFCNKPAKSLLKGAVACFHNQNSFLQC